MKTLLNKVFVHNKQAMNEKRFNDKCKTHLKSTFKFLLDSKCVSGFFPVLLKKAFIYV